MDALYRIKLYAVWHLNGLKEKGEQIPPTETTMTAIRYIAQLRMELEDENMDELNKIVEPLTDLLQFVEKIKEDVS